MFFGSPGSDDTTYGADNRELYYVSPPTEIVILYDNDRQNRINNNWKVEVDSIAGENSQSFDVFEQ